MEQQLLKEFNKNKELIKLLEMRNTEIERTLGLDKKYKEKINEKRKEQKLDYYYIHRNKAVSNDGKMSSSEGKKAYTCRDTHQIKYYRRAFRRLGIAYQSSYYQECESKKKKNKKILNLGKGST